MIITLPTMQAKEVYIFMKKLSTGESSLYEFIESHIDGDAIIVDQSTLSEHLNVSERTIRRYLEKLEDMSLIRKIHVIGTTYAYSTNIKEFNPARKNRLLSIRTNVLLAG